MKPKELFENLRVFLRALVWTGTANKIFGDQVYITSENPVMVLSQLVSPSCYIIETGQRSHPEHNNIITQNFSILLFVENMQDNYGEGSILSACRTANQSKGAGVFDIEEEVLSNLVQETALSGAKIVLMGKNRIRMGVVKGARPALFRNLNFQARVYLYG